MIKRVNYVDNGKHTYRRFNKRVTEHNHIYDKFIAIDVETGKKTTAITLSRGRIAIGDDVWRMSNKADICDYPFRIVDQYEFDLFYKRVEAPTYPSFYQEDLEIS